MNIISINDISVYTVCVTEEIEEKNLHRFIRSSIKNNNPLVSKNSYYTFNYNKKISTYEIIFYEKKSKNCFLEPFLLLEKYKKNDSITRLLICENYFLLIYKEKLLHLKKINNSTVEEISTYVKQVYKIEQFEVIEVSYELLLSLDKIQNITYDTSFFPLSPSYSFLYFILFTVSLSFFLIFILFFNNLPQVRKIDTNSSSLDKMDSSSNIVVKTVNFFNQLKISAIAIDKINYDNKRANLILYHKSDQTLLKFVKNYPNRLKIKVFKYNEMKKVYQMEVIFEY